jgi:hypothetical protein
MKDSFKAIARMVRGNSCYTKAVDTQNIDSFNREEDSSSQDMINDSICGTECVEKSKPSEPNGYTTMAHDSKAVETEAVESTTK